jgi:pimeloyl-ACP methyl ester carboxylesterase
MNFGRLLRTAAATVALFSVQIAGAARAELLGVSLTAGTRETAGGDAVDYLLFVPKPASGLAEAPFPAVILTHGFARDYGRHIDTALFLASRGIAVMTPNMVSLLGLVPAQRRNIRNTADHVRWLAARSSDPVDPLYGLIDKDRIALAGHSAGGAVSFEAALQLQDDGRPAAALILLDAVPYPRTVRKSDRLHPLPLLSLRAEPAACNAFASVSSLIDELSFAAEDLLVVGATHCDPEGPSDVACSIACGGIDAAKSNTFRTLTYRFLQEALAVPTLTATERSFDTVVGDLTAEGAVTEPVASSP